MYPYRSGVRAFGCSSVCVWTVPSRTQQAFLTKPCSRSGNQPTSSHVAPISSMGIELSSCTINPPMQLRSIALLQHPRDQFQARSRHADHLHWPCLSDPLSDLGVLLQVCAVLTQARVSTLLTKARAIRHAEPFTKFVLPSGSIAPVASPSLASKFISDPRTVCVKSSVFSSPCCKALPVHVRRHKCGLAHVMEVHK